MAIEIVNRNRKSLRRRLFEDDENVKIAKSESPVSDTDNSTDKPSYETSSPRHISTRSTPLSERQQIALLRKLTAAESPHAESYEQCDNELLKRPGVRYKRNERGETLLHLAAIKGECEEVRKLLDQGTPVNITDFAGWTALHEACNHGWLDVVTLLVQYEANVNAKGLANVTPLHDAAANGHHEIVKFLLKVGADPNQRNAKGKTPLEVAGSEEVAIALRTLSENVQLTDVTSSGEELEKAVNQWQSETSPCHLTNNLSDLTMRKNSPQNQTQKGADKPTSPRLTLRFQSIRARDDKNPTTTKVNDLSTNPTKYPSYCVTMEAKGDVYEFQKEDCHVSSSQNSVPVSESEVCVPSAMNKDNDNSSEVKCAVDSTADIDMPLPSEKETSDLTSAKINGGRLSGDSTSKDRDYLSDNEKEDSRRKRRKSNDSVQSRHSSIGHSSVKSHKSPSGKTLHSDGHGEQKNSPKGKKRGSLSSSDTESNPSDSEMPDIMMQDSLASANHNGAFMGLHSLKVPPLKIVIPSGSNSLELETRERSKVSSSKTALPYVVNTAESMDVATSDAAANSFNSDGSKDGMRSLELTPSKSKEDSHPQEERFQRVTRSSQRMQAAMSNTTPTMPSGNDAPHAPPVLSTGQKGEQSSESSNEDQVPAPIDVHPRKRKLRARDAALDCNSSISPPVLSTPGSTGNEDVPVQPQQQQTPPPPQQHHLQPQQLQPPQCIQQMQQLLNSYQMFIDIRKQVDKKRKTMFVVHPKPPQGFKNFLLNRCSYVLAGNAASRLAVPMIPPPQSLEGPIKELFIKQEKERYKLRLQHLIEREKLVLSAEQEVLRVHGRAARAMANQPIPLSACSILKDEEIYNLLDADQEDKDKNVRSRYNGRLFLSWLQDVDDKWEKIKDRMLLRHHNEAESLHAVQKLDWEWKMKELAMCDLKATPDIDDISVPIVHVNDDFDITPT